MALTTGKNGVRRITSKARLRARAQAAAKSMPAEQRAAVARANGRKGGRPAGSRSKRTEALEKAMREGKTPLQYMLEVMRNEGSDTARRDDMAKAAAPYLHPRLSSTEVSTDPERPAALDEGQQLGLVRQIAFALALGARLQRQGHQLPEAERVAAKGGARRTSP